MFSKLQRTEKNTGSDNTISIFSNFRLNAHLLLPYFLEKHLATPTSPFFKLVIGFCFTCKIIVLIGKNTLVFIE